MENTRSFGRREFVKLAGMAGAAALIAPGLAFAESKKRHLIAGSTFILWGYGAPT